MNLKRIVLNAVMLLLIGVLSAAGCAPAAEPLDREADFLGFITEISPLRAQGLVGTVTVESHADKIVTRYVVTVKSGTLIFDLQADGLRKVGFQSLQAKQWVKLWFEGPVLESFPIRATAVQIVITPTPGQ